MGTRLTIHAELVNGKLKGLDDDSCGFSLGKLYGYESPACRKSLEYLYTHCCDFREDVDSFDDGFHDEFMEKANSYFACHGCTPVFRMNALYLKEFLKLYAEDQAFRYGKYNDNIDGLIAAIDDGDVDLVLPFSWG